MSLEWQECSNFGCSKKGKNSCSACGDETYCSKECQKEAWSNHKENCRKTTDALEKVELTKSFDPLSVRQLKKILRAKMQQSKDKDESQKKEVLEQMETAVEKPRLCELVSRYVKPTQSEIITLFREPLPVQPSSLSYKQSGSSSSGSSSSSSGSSSGSSSKHTSSSSSGSRGGAGGATRVPKNKGGNTPIPTPDMLRQQAQMMRRDPGLIRRSAPELKDYTDAQIRDMADQYEKAADCDPETFKLMMKQSESLKEMSPTERKQFQNIQEGIQGIRPMDDKWVDEIVQTLKENAKVFKNQLKGTSMGGGWTSEQVESFIDMASQMDAWLLRLLIKLLIFMGKSAKPLQDAYAKFDSYTFGSAKYILGFVAVIIFFYICSATWWLMRVVFGFMYRLLASTGAVASMSSAGSSAASYISSAASSLTGIKAGGDAVGAAVGDAVGAAVGAAASSMAGAAAASAKNAGGSKRKDNADDEFENFL